MKCEICNRELAKNGVKNCVQYYLCTHCKKSYSGKPNEPNHHIFEEYIARLLFLKCVKQINEFTQTKWTINQIARLLGLHHRDINKWADNRNLPKINRNEFIKYIENRENGFDILCLLGFCKATAPSENLNKIIHRKERVKIPKDDTNFHINEAEYFRLINMPLTNRKEAIFVLGALLGCRTSEIIGVRYSDIDYVEKTIFFHRTLTFGKNIAQSENNIFITNRKYPLTRRMIDVIEWLKKDNEKNKEKLGNDFNKSFTDFICIQENGNPFNSMALNKKTLDIQNKALLRTKFIISWQLRNGENNEVIRQFQFKWLRYSVKLMMLKAGVSKEDIKIIFGYKIAEKSVFGYIQNENQLEIMRKAYDVLDKYIDENMDKYQKE